MTAGKQAVSLLKPGPQAARPQGSRREQEDARLLALDGLGLTGTGPEERFDRVTSMAQSLLRVPMATITLVGREGRWHKSAQGIRPTPTPRDDSIHDYPVHSREVLVVEDMTLDERFAGRSFAAGSTPIRFFAGHPLQAPDGQVVGTLSLMDARPREFTAAERDTFDELALWAQNELNRCAELDRAAVVQRGLLPRRAGLDVPRYELAAACLPSRTVGGDLLDYYFAPDGDVVITLGDVMGKGIGAAIMMATVRAAMRSAGRLNTPSEAVHQAAVALEEDLRRTTTIVTLCHLRFRPSSGRISFADAGHGMCLLVRDGKILPRPGSGGLPLGAGTGDGYPECVGRLDPGDTLVAFSDGLLDLYDSVDAAFAQVCRVAAQSPDARSIVDHFEERTRQAQPADDVTLFALRRPQESADRSPEQPTAGA